MDDMKRGIYIEARRLIKDENFGYICLALKRAASDLLGISDIKFYEETPALNEKFLEELFSEFFALYDGYTWFKYEEESGQSNFYQHYKKDPHSAWWGADIIEARLAILNFIIESSSYVNHVYPS